MTARCSPLLLLAFLLAASAHAWAQAGNDDFAARIPLSGNAVTAVSNLKAATHEAGEPNHANNGGSRSLWWTWTAPATGTVSFSTFGGGATPGRIHDSAFTRALAVYTGDSLASLSEVASAGTLKTYSETINAPPGPSCNVPVVAGTTYQIAVDGPAYLSLPDDGTVVLAINQAPTIYSAAGASGTAGASFTYTILASNNPTGFNATNLPAGLSLNPTTGIISGTLPAAGTYTVGLAASNPGGTGTGTLTLAVSNAATTMTPAAPVITSDAATAGCVGVLFSYSAYAGTAVSYTADGLPPGVTLDKLAGYVYGTPTTAGLYNVTFTATNAIGTGTATVAIRIAAAPVRPVITSALSALGTVGGSLSYSISVSDTSTAGKPTVYAASGLPPGMGFDPSTGVLQGAPTQAGTWSVPISASNAGGTGSAVVTVVVAAPATAAVPPPAPPVLTESAVLNLTAGSAFSYGLTASNAPTSFAADNLPPGLSLNTASGVLSGTPTAIGVYRVPVSATNAYGTSSATLTVSVQATASLSPAVVISAAEAIGYVGGALNYQTVAAPALYLNSSSYYYAPVGNGKATYAASGLPPGLSINSTYGAVSGTPTTAGTYAATVVVTPAAGSSPAASAGSATVTFVIAAGSAPAVVGVPVFTSQAGQALDMATTYSSTTVASASDNPTSYAASSLPPGLSFNTSSGTISGRPTAAGTYSVPVTATNATGTGSATLTIFVAATTTAPAAPVLTSDATAAGSVGTGFSYVIATSGGATSYGAGSLPPGLSLSTSTISGTPTQAGVFTLPVSATNATGTTPGTLTITIGAGPAAPAITGYAAARATLGQSFSYGLYGSNAPTGYTAANLPPGLTLNAMGGTISGTPTATGVWNVPVTATNAAGTGSGSVTITVVRPGVPAFSCAAAASGTVGSAFSFSLYATSYVTGYTASDLPPGLSINATSGSLSGSPTQAGVFSVPVTATNAGGTTGATLTITINTPASSSPPVVSSAAAASGTVGAAFSYTVTASNSPTGYDLGASLPPGLAFSPSTGTISGTPSQAGTYLLPVSATNAGGTGRAKVTLTFSAQPTAVPVITSPAMFGGFFSDPIYYPVTATNSPTSYAASGLPAGLSIDPATGVITGVATGANSSPIIVTAANGVGQGSATLVLVRGNGAPARITSALAANGVAGTALSYAITANNTATSSFSVVNLPPGLSLNASTGLISGTPTVSGTYATTVSVGTPYGTASGKVTFNVATSAAPRPMLTSSAGVNAAASDPCYQPLTFGNNPTSVSVTNLPAGLSYDTARGLISGMPTTAGTYSVGISASNSAGTTSGTLTVAVAPAYANPARIISAAGASAPLGTPFTYTVVTNQTSVGGLSATDLPPGLSYTYNPLKITGTPTTAGNYLCTMAVSTSQGQTTAYLTMVVGDGATAPPVISSAAAAGGTAGAAFSYSLAATGSPTSYAASGLPAGVSLDPVAGTISGTPTAAGTFTVPISATNAAGTGNATLTLIVAALAPALNSASLELTATLGTPTSLSRIPATNGATSFTASGLPPGLSLDPVSGVISGTPTVPGLYQTAVSAANAYGSVGAVIDILVKDAASAPVFYGFAANAAGTVGVSFSQSLYASGNGTITYAAGTLPPGLYLNSATGKIFGTPTQVGAYSVAVSATNASGADSATLTFLIAGPTALPTFSGLDLSATCSVGGSLYVNVYSSNARSCVASGLPAGVNFSSASGSGALRGSPTTAGVYPVTFTATNDAGNGMAVVTLVVSGDPPAPPVVASAAGAAGSVGRVFTYRVFASVTSGIGAPISYGASGLPDGWQFNPVTGTITATPTTAGTYPITITATNVSGTGSGVVTVRVDAAVPAVNAVPVITSAASAYFTGVNNQYPYSTSPTNFSYAIAAANSPTSFAATGLPPGLVLNPTTGIISGRPLTAGSFNVGISAANAVGTGSATLRVVAPAALPSLSVPLVINGTVGGGLAYAVSPYTNNYLSGNPASSEPTAFAAAGLPPGLSFNAATGLLTGTPSQAGTFLTTFTATDRAGSTSAVVTFNVAASPPAPATTGSAPTLNSAAAVSGFVGAPVSAYLSGGASFAAGSLPAGVSLNPSTGEMTGTPTTAGVYTVPVAASNAFGTGAATLTFDIAAASAPPLITSNAGASATVGVAFGYTIYTSSAAGTAYPATGYGASGLPPGLSVSTTGYLGGTPTQAGLYTIPLTATAGGVTGNATLTLNVLPATSAVPSTPVPGGPAGTLGFVGVPFSLSSGLAGFTPDGALPAGLVFNAASGALTGLPATAGSFDVSFTAAGTNGGAAGHGAINLRIAVPDLSLPRVSVQPIGGTVAQGGAFALSATVSGAPAPSLQWLHDGVAVSGATGSVLSLAAAQPADAGTYVLTLVNSSGRASSNGALLVVTQTYGNWQTANFTPAEINAGLATDGYDFNADGLSNLLEYAFGRDPRTGQGGAVPVGTRPAGGGLRLQFTRDTGKTDLVYTVEASTDLWNWTAIARSAAGGITANLGGAGAVSEGVPVGGVTTVTVTDGQGAGPSRFVRLRVERP